jgi:hypothetical protein
MNKKSNGIRRGSIDEDIFNVVYEIKDFTSVNEFVKYVLTECSNCVIEESCIDEIKNSKLYDVYKNQKGDNCKEIRKVELSSEYLMKFPKGVRVKRTLLALKIIDLFMSLNLLNKRGNVYYLLDTNRRLSWTNIKQLKMRHLSKLSDRLKGDIRSIFGEYDILLLVKCLFWYFRKAVVDSILYDIINTAEKSMGSNVVVMSVGSTKLSSDYDISVDSDYNTSAYIINKFTKMIDMIFGDDSESIFDTNVYGVSFTKRNKDDVFSEEHKCNDEEKQSIKYMKGSLDMEVSQMIWGYVKLLLKMGVILKQDDKVYDKLYSYLDDHFDKNLLFQQALNIVNTYKSNVLNYKSIVSRYEEYMVENNNVGDKEYLVGNFISYVNYNGSETYLTNSAFLDVVINQQLCLNKNQIKLSKPYMYFISYVENMSDLLTHYHKTKYTLRAERALLNMNKLLWEEFNKLNMNVNVVNKWKSVYIDIFDILKWIMVTQKKCDDDAYKCQVFDLMYMVVYSIVNVSLVFNEYTNIIYSDINKSVDKFSLLRFPDIKENMFDILESPVKK